MLPKIDIGCFIAAQRHILVSHQDRIGTACSSRLVLCQRLLAGRKQCAPSQKQGRQYHPFYPLSLHFPFSFLAETRFAVIIRVGVILTSNDLYVSYLKKIKNCQVRIGPFF